MKRTFLALVLVLTLAGILFGGCQKQGVSKSAPAQQKPTSQK